MWFTVAQLCVVTSVLAQTNAATLKSGSCGGLADVLMGRSLVACTATDAHNAAVRIPRGVCNEWSEGLLTGGQL